MDIVLRRCIPGTIDQAMIDQVARLPGVVIVDQSPRMLVVKGDKRVVCDFATEGSGWKVFAEEVNYSLPDSRHKIADSV